MILPNSLQNSQGEAITTVDDWLKLAPPQRKERHWKPYRSALEFAKAWFRDVIPTVPKEIDSILETQTTTQGIQIRLAIPEAKTALDNFRGNTRNNDMLIVGYSRTITSAMTIETKADEEYGPLIGPYRKSKAKTRSNVPSRIEALSLAIFGRKPDDEIDSLRYQLLQGFAAALIEARNRNATQAVFIVHEFLSAGLDNRKVAENHRDLERFIQVLSGIRDFKLQPSHLHGPFSVPGGDFVPSDIPAFIGKAVTNLC